MAENSLCSGARSGDMATATGALGPILCCPCPWNDTNHHAGLGCLASLISIPTQMDGIGATVLHDGPFVLGHIGPELHQRAAVQLVSFHKGPGTRSKASLRHTHDCYTHNLENPHSHVLATADWLLS